MNTPAQPEPVAVVCERGGDDAANVERYLQAAGLANAAWYAPCDADDADRALRAGQVQRAIFPTVPALLAALWDGSITVDCWVAPGVRVEIAAPGEHWTAAQLATLLVCWEQSRRDSAARGRWPVCY